jgi:heme exporter protein D
VSGNGNGTPRAPGLWVPYALLGVLFSIVVFAGTFIGTVRVMERHLDEVDHHLARLDRLGDAAADDRREFAVRLGRLEAGAPQERRGP